jgi:cytosine/adenosine deaminase-related metal-dependent hydrolase
VIVGPGFVVTGGPHPDVLEDAGVRVVGAHIAQIGRAADLAAAFPNETLWPARGRVMMPGLVNTHAHLARHLARGLGLSQEQDWARYEAALSPDDIYWAAGAALVEGLRHGVTTVFDFHRSTGSVENSLFELRAAAARVGARVGLCYGTRERDTPAERRAGFEETRGLASELRRARAGRAAALVGVCAGQLEGVERALLEAHEQAGGELGVHAVLEMDATPAARWNPRERWPETAFGTLWAHVERAPRSLLAEAQERGHALSAVGTASVSALLREAEVSWGSDAGVVTPPAADPRQAPNGAEARAHYRRLFVNGPQFAELTFGGALGYLTPGAHADLVLVDYLPATQLDGETLLAHLWSGLLRAPVSGVMVAGQILVDNGQLVTVDEREVAARARECAARLWQRLA